MSNEQSVINDIATQPSGSEKLEQCIARLNGVASGIRQLAEDICGPLPDNTTIESNVESIRANLLSRSAQALTEAERKQVLANLGNPEFKAFVDMWISAGYVYGKHYSDYLPDEVNYPNEPFVCNGERFTYEGAIKVYELYTRRLNNNLTVSFFAVPNRACLPIWIPNYNITGFVNAFGSSSFSKIVFASNANPCVVNLSGSVLAAFNSCPRLQEVEGILDVASATSVNNWFSYCPKLTEVRVRNIKANISFKDSPLLSYDSINYMVTNAANTAIITITVHPDVYAKLTGDTTNAAAAALSDDELESWQNVLLAAVQKQISFATA